MPAKKKCNACQRVKSRLDFRWFRRDGGLTLHAYCRDCERARDRLRDTSHRTWKPGKYQPGPKAAARGKLNRAIRAGRLTRELCHCGVVGQAHHEDYREPFAVTWLCAQHHAERHRLDLPAESIAAAMRALGA